MASRPVINKKKTRADNKHSSQQASQVAALFQQGLKFHQQGQLTQAKAVYEEVLQKQPAHSDALHLLGAIAAQLHQPELAVELIGKSIAINPGFAEAHFNLAKAWMQLQQLEQALASFDQALALNPAHLNALIIRGNVLTERKQWEAAKSSYEQAIALKPDYAEVYSNLGNALKYLKRFDAALTNYDRAIALKPDYAEAHSNRGDLLMECNRLEEALASYDQAIALKPDYADAWSNRGLALQKLHRMDEALSCFDQAIAHNQWHQDAYFNRGVVLNKLQRLEDALPSFDQVITLNPQHANAYFSRGHTLHKLQQLDAALSNYDQAIAIDPQHADAYANRGWALQKLQRLEEALLSYDQAIAINPLHADAYSNRGTALEELQRLGEALLSFEQAIALDPLHANAYSNRGCVLHKFQRLDEAIASFDQAIAINPGYADAHYNKAHALLLAGHYVPGWKLYEWRWKREGGLVERFFPQPLWTGAENLSGKTILLHGEQGRGDRIQFCRYAKLVKQLGATVLLEVPSPLTALFAEMDGVDVVLEFGKPLPAFDYHCPLLSLPLAFKTELETIPNPGVYLKCNASKRSDWSQQLGEKTKPRVGLVWRGSTEHKNDHNRSLPLAQLLPHLPSNFDYVSLQKEVPEEERELLRTSSIRHFGEALQDFSDTAALCDRMDIVLSVDTSVAHLAAAMGKPTWILLPYAPDWRWLLNREDSPWYSSVKLYRQAAPGEWHPVLEKVSHDLLQVFAVAGFDQALAINPAHLNALIIRGNVLMEHKQWEEAKSSYEQAIALKPDYAEVYSNLGNALKYLKRFDAALGNYDRAIALKPDYAEAHSNRGDLLMECNRLEEALASYDQAIALKPDYADAWSNRGLALQKHNRLHEAVTSFDHAIALDPLHHDAFSNRGLALQALHQLKAAVASYDKVIELKPDFGDAYFNKSLALLLDGQFRQGWELYAWRWKCAEGLKPRPFLQPLWVGADKLIGKTILLHGEQGLGDSIQFCRYAKLVKQGGATVLLEVPRQLTTLLAELEGVDAVLEQGKPLPAFDCHCPLLSLPLAFKTDLHTIPNAGPYLHSSASKRMQWKQRLGEKTKPRVGLVWRGSTVHKNDQNRSLPLAEWLPHLPGNFDYVSLQKEVRAEDLELLPTSSIRHFGEALQDFSDTAALCDLMDIVLSVDTSVAHLAAAMGKPTWILLPYAPDWRWLLERDDSPWYSSVRLYRQSEAGQWMPMLEKVAHDLFQLLAAESDPLLQTQAPQAATLFQQGLKLHQQGQLSQAKAVYEEVLHMQPAHSDALQPLWVGADTCWAQLLPSPITRPWRWN